MSLKKIADGSKSFKDSYGRMHVILKQENSFVFHSLVNAQERINCIYYWTKTPRSWDYDKIASFSSSKTLDLGLVNVNFCRFDPIFSDDECAFKVEFIARGLRGKYRFSKNISLGGNSNLKFSNDFVIIEKSDWLYECDFDYVVGKFGSRDINAIKFKIENDQFDAEAFCNYVNFNARKMILANKKHCQEIKDLEHKMQQLRNQIKKVKRNKDLIFSEAVKT